MTIIKPGGLYDTSQERMTLVSRSTHNNNVYRLIFLSKTVENGSIPLQIQTTHKDAINEVELGELFPVENLQHWRHLALKQLKAHRFDTKYYLEEWKGLDSLERFEVGKVFKDNKGHYYLVLELTDGYIPVYYSTNEEDSYYSPLSNRDYTSWRESLIQATATETETYLTSLQKSLEESLKDLAERTENLSKVKSVVHIAIRQLYI